MGFLGILSSPVTGCGITDTIPIDPVTPPGDMTWPELVADVLGTPSQWWRFTNTSGLTITATAGSNATLASAAPHYNLGPLVEDDGGGSSMGWNGNASSPTVATFPTVASGPLTVVFVGQINATKTDKHNILSVGDGVDGGPGDLQFAFENDTGTGLRVLMVSKDNSAAGVTGRVTLIGQTAAQVPIGETFIAVFVRTSGGMFCVINGVQVPLVLGSGSPVLPQDRTPVETWSAPAAGTSWICSYIGVGGGFDGLIGEMIVDNSAISLADAIRISSHSRISRVIAFDLNGGTIAEGAGAVSFPVDGSVYPLVGIIVGVVTPPALGSLTTGPEALIYTPPGSVSGNTPVSAVYSITKGALSDTADFTATITDVASPPSSDLPEDEPLPAPTAGTSTANVAGFDALFASGGNAVQGRRYTLASGSYGSKTIAISGTAANPITLVGAANFASTFTKLTINGNYVIVSGLKVDPGDSVATGTVFVVSSHHVRATRCLIRNGGYIVVLTPTVADFLLDHCEVTRSRIMMVTIQNPINQRRPIFARNWFHQPLVGTDEAITWSYYFSLAGTNSFREAPLDSIVRFNYFGPGRASGKLDDFEHHKVSQHCVAFNRFEGANRDVQRFGMRYTRVCNYAPNALLLMYDSDGRIFGNLFAQYQATAGAGPWYDDVKNSSSSMFHAHKRSRIAGNSGPLLLGALGTTANMCTQSRAPYSGAADPGDFPLAAGQIKPSAQIVAVSGGPLVTYAADNASDPNVGIKIRAHTGAITQEPNGTGGGCGPSPGKVWVEHLDPTNAVGQNPLTTAAPAAWRTDLFALYPWIEAICPNPTSLTGGPGGSAPWSIAQALQPGSVATATANTCGPRRTTGGGLP